jgi:tetratricopeptide (TPR) repeat protein
VVEVKLPLARVLSDRAEFVDWGVLSPDEVINHLGELYSFLGVDVDVAVEKNTATIRADTSDQLDVDGQRLLDRAVEEASRGRYSQAMSLLERVLQRAPGHVVARRNLGMAHLEIGEVDRAERLLVEALRLDPGDAWSLLLIGNIYLGHRNDLESAAEFYELAASADPDDPYLLSNIGALHARQNNVDKAREYFQRAIGSDRRYAMGYFNLAVLEDKEGNVGEAIRVLEVMFDQCESADIRADEVFENSRQLYRKLRLDLARAECDSLMNGVRERREELEEIGGVEIELVRDDSLSVSARTEIAWHHRQPSHVVRYKAMNRAVVPHLLAHELEHILMEHEAREQGRNRFFITTEETMERATSAISGDIYKLKRTTGSRRLTTTSRTSCVALPTAYSTCRSI